MSCELIARPSDALIPADQGGSPTTIETSCLG